MWGVCFTVTLGGLPGDIRCTTSDTQENFPELPFGWQPGECQTPKDPNPLLPWAEEFIYKSWYFVNKVSKSVSDNKKDVGRLLIARGIVWILLKFCKDLGLVEIIVPKVGAIYYPLHWSSSGNVTKKFPHQLWHSCFWNHSQRAWAVNGAVD